MAVVGDIVDTAGLRIEFDVVVVEEVYVLGAHFHREDLGVSVLVDVSFVLYVEEEGVVEGLAHTFAHVDFGRFGEKHVVIEESRVQIEHFRLAVTVVNQDIMAVKQPLDLQLPRFHGETSHLVHGEVGLSEGAEQSTDDQKVEILVELLGLNGQLMVLLIQNVYVAEVTAVLPCLDHHVDLL